MGNYTTSPILLSSSQSSWKQSVKLVPENKSHTLDTEYDHSYQINIEDLPEFIEKIEQHHGSVTSTEQGKSGEFSFTIHFRDINVTQCGIIEITVQLKANRTQEMVGEPAMIRNVIKIPIQYTVENTSSTTQKNIIQTSCRFI